MVGTFCTMEDDDRKRWLANANVSQRMLNTYKNLVEDANGEIITCSSTNNIPHYMTYCKKFYFNSTFTYYLFNDNIILSETYFVYIYKLYFAFYYFSLTFKAGKLNSCTFTYND